MARGLRNKLRRRNKREKRVRYGKKELLRLMKTVENDQDAVVVKDAADVVRDMGLVKNKKPSEDEMELSDQVVEKEKPANSIGNTLKKVIKEHGTIPRWIHPRKAQKVQNLKKRAKREKKSHKTYKSKPKK